MAPTVLKFGGTSVADLDKIAAVADIIARRWHDGEDLVVVVSAMAGETDRLIKLAVSFGALVDGREFDTIVSSGEQVSVGLLALALQQRDVSARSWQGWQVPIVTDNNHGNARVLTVDNVGIAQRIARERMVAVVSGFQGVTAQGRITTLGRGGSDTSAVLLSEAVQARSCEIYTDVAGVYTADPRIVPNACLIEEIGYEEMLELASLGAKVLHPRAVEAAMRYKIPLRVRSTFDTHHGTVVRDDLQLMEQHNVTGIAHHLGDAKLDLRDVPDRPGVAATVFTALADADINIDMIVQTASATRRTDMSFTLHSQDLAKARQLLDHIQPQVGYRDYTFDCDVGKISVVGQGMRSNTGVAKKMFAALSRAHINIMVISTSEIRISVLVKANEVPRAVQAIHEEFGLSDRRSPPTQESSHPQQEVG